jgi:hypothetical protein
MQEKRDIAGGEVEGRWQPPDEGMVRRCRQGARAQAEKTRGALPAPTDWGRSAPSRWALGDGGDDRQVERMRDEHAG